VPPGATRALVFAAALALAGCDEPCNEADDDTGCSPWGPQDPGGKDTFYVVDRMWLPTTPELARDFALNLDGDAQNRGDNMLERIFAYLGDAIPDLDPQASTDEAIDSGTLVTLNRIKATALTTATGVGLWLYFGRDDGGESFTVEPWSPADAKVTGQIVGGQISAGPGTVMVGINIGLPEPLLLRLIGARVRGNVTEGAIGSEATPALLGGAILKEDLIEAFWAQFQQTLASDCDADCNCVVGSRGESVRDLLDEDPDCTISLAEIEQSNLIAQLTVPDVDLLDADGNFNPRDDGVLDSVAIGLAFTSVGAVFTAPADPDVDN
jgi:hypothetical protein